MKKNNPFLFRVFTILLVCLGSCKPQTTKKNFLSNPKIVDSIIDSYVQKGAYPVLYVRVEDKEGNPVYEHGSKNNALLPDTQIDGETWFRIWSMSKIVTIAIALDLMEEGKLNLTDPVTKFMPEFKDLKVAVTQDGKTIADITSRMVGENKSEYDACPIKLVSNDSVMTVLDLINHKAGFYYATTGIKCLDEKIATQNIPILQNSQQMINAMAKIPLMQQPGSTYFYGANTAVLGLVAERATGKSLKTLVEERVTGPLQIQGLRYKKTENISLLPTFSGRDSIIRMANQAEMDMLGEYIPSYEPENELYMGGEGMIATANGYTDFLRMLSNHGTLNGHRFLEKETVEAMYSPHTQLDNETGYNGYNLWVTKEAYRERNIGDAGLWIGGGYEATHFWVDPKREFVAVILSQMFWIPETGYDLENKIRGAMYRQIFKSEEKD